jgi:lipid II:glycine glycyltransferase (peptidoglycan interpeptide bridge formation enzyme)
MFTYRLQWEAMLHAKAAGCTEYDLWGAPDEFTKDDPMWGVFRFKDGFGGQVVRTLGAWDYPVRPTFYRLYSQVLPRILNVMRRRGKSETKRGTSA